MGKSSQIAFGFLVNAALLGGAVFFYANTALAAEAFSEKTKAPQKSVVGFEKVAMISMEELQQTLASRRGALEGPFLVDLRNEADFRVKFIPDSTNIPFKKLSFLAEKMFSKQDEIVLIGYPDTDHVSINAAILLHNKGFVNTKVLKGGIASWTGELEKKESE